VVAVLFQVRRRVDVDACAHGAQSTKRSRNGGDDRVAERPAGGVAELTPSGLSRSAAAAARPEGVIA